MRGFWPHPILVTVPLVATLWHCINQFIIIIIIKNPLLTQSRQLADHCSLVCKYQHSKYQSATLFPTCPANYTSADHCSSMNISSQHDDGRAEHCTWHWKSEVYYGGLSLINVVNFVKTSPLYILQKDTKNIVHVHAPSVTFYHSMSMSMSMYIALSHYRTVPLMHSVQCAPSILLKQMRLK